MKLTLTIAAAVAALLYAIVKQVAPNFPITPDQILQGLILILGWLGVVVVEGFTRAALVKAGFKQFMPQNDKK